MNGNLEPRGRGYKVIIPPGRSLVEHVRQGMSLNSSSTVVAAKHAGISERLYRFVRKLLILIDRNAMTINEVALAYQAIDRIEETKSLVVGETLAGSLLDKYWTRSTTTGQLKLHGKALRVTQRQHKRFYSTITTIRNATSNNEEMTIPSLSKQERQNAEQVLIDCMDALWQLFNRVRNVETPSD